MPDEPLPAVEAQPGDQIRQEPPGRPVYADVTEPGGLRPILPAWLASREQLRHTTRRVAGREWHRARYHGLRLPWYLAAAAFWSVVGGAWLAWDLLHWWLFPVPLEAHASAAAEGWRAWKSLHTEHKRTTKTRAFILAAVLVGGVFASELLWASARWVLLGLAGIALAAAARFGRPDGVRIVTPAAVPGQYEKLTPDIIVRALGSLGIAGIDRWLREGKEIAFAHPVRQDGPGWRAELDLPYGVTATQVIERREQFASGLRRPLGAVWPEPVTSEHAGRLEVWVGQQDVSKAKAPAWPLLRSGQADVFRPFPFAVDVRGRKVTAPLIYHNWLIGSIPRQGKTATVREIACAIALDPLCRMWVHELKGTGDLDPLEAVSERFVSGLDDESIACALESLRKLRAEVERRAPRVKALPLDICPEKRVTREIAQRYPALRPLGCIIDECQNLFAHEKYGKEAGELAEWTIKVGPAMGVFLVLATQRPDKASLPTGVSANVSIRFCLKVMGQLENDMILGTSAYKNGVRATTFRPKIDAGLGYLISEDPALVCRPHFLDVPATKSVVARARVLRERAGTLPVQAHTEAPERDVLADVLAVMGGEPGMHWPVLSGRLAERFPDRWADVTADALSAQLRALGVPSVTVSMAGQKARGCRKDAIEAAAR